MSLKIADLKLQPYYVAANEFNSSNNIDPNTTTMKTKTLMTLKQYITMTS